MKKGLFILIPVIILAVYMSRPVILPANQDFGSLALELQTPAEEKAVVVSIATVPEKILQGDPVLIKINGLKGTSTIRALNFENKPVGIFVENGQPQALGGVDLRMRTGRHPISLTLTDGRVIQQDLIVGERAIAKIPLGIPESLGGNTTESEKELAESLVKEGQLINSIDSSKERLWSGKFRYPLNGEIVVTDVYGYSRVTVGSTFSHKGTDYRAAVGTPVYAMNTGVVAYIGYLRNYGNTIVIDHGLGLQTIYMHLSKISVVKGQKVEKGSLIGKSGDTGYVLGPHLHVSIKIDHVSIDPEKFMKLLGS